MGGSGGKKKRDEGIQKVAILPKNNGKSQKKEALLLKNDDFREVVQVPGISKKNCQHTEN